VGVIPLTRGRRSDKPDTLHPLNRSVPIRGTFRAPSGRPGSMSGVMRLHRLVIAAGRLRAVVFFTGELLDSDGSRVGVGSRRAVVPAEIARSSSGIVVSIGPVEVDLIGLTVSVRAFTLAMGAAVPVQDEDAEDHFESHSS
jgi:hypothetical protein